MYYYTYKHAPHVLSHVKIHYTCTITRPETLHMYYHTSRYITNVLSHIQIHYTCTITWQIFSEFLAHTLVYSEFLDFVADSTYQYCYCLRVAKDMYVCKTFTAEYHYLKQRNFTFFYHIVISESHYNH
jgi:hypothetical protein